MTSRQFTAFGLVPFFSLLGLLSVAPAGFAQQSRPNVVLILMDDMGAVDLSGEGSTFYRSPHIDRIASEGMRFTNGYATCCVCSPSRASIQLGTFPARNGITDWIGAKSGMEWTRPYRVLPADYVHALPNDDVTLAEALVEAGYRTFFAGKWHLGDRGSWPTDHGYQVNKGGHDRGSPPGGYFSPYNNPVLENGPAGESLPMRLAQETADYITSNKDDPFFAMLSFYSVHGPVQTTKRLWEKYRKLAPELPEGGQRFSIDRTLPVRQVQDHPVYAGMVETVDDAVGVVLQALEENGLADNTVVIFTSDNGGVSSGDAYSTCNLPFRGGKGRQWEGGIREPFYIRYPRQVAAGSTCDVPVTGADLYPTILDLCGLPLRPEQHVDGVSLKPLLGGGQIADRPLYWHYPHYGNQGGEPHAIIRQGEWKLIHYYEDGRNELYQLDVDPGERSDVSRTHPQHASRLWKQLDGWLTDVGAKRPKPDPRYDPAKTDAWFEKIHSDTKDRLEKFHSQILQENWQPNESWWGSLATGD
ncbi:sulfatase [Roseiconus nitratireducens]|uniref:Sulfatase n=1 Tax=Roseiconus nitratireducens TaxID=2605748 RepID=A0A5M6DC97_9BACT|nr:sulfatase [Roseiconus nitratireducens]KAA5545174.1 sulfatase [Roseiconus nitratireducens]